MILRPNFIYLAIFNLSNLAQWSMTHVSVVWQTHNTNLFLLYTDFKDIFLPRYKRLKWVSSTGWWGAPLEIGWRALSPERSQLRWLGHLSRMPPGHLPLEVFLACPTGGRPWGRPRTHWSDYVTRLAWERLGILPVELEEVSGEREAWVSLLRQLPLQPGPG